ncbi:MAG: efflux transporter periplasmic adaptor subunit, partial [Roseococcus sp.]
MHAALLLLALLLAPLPVAAQFGPAGPPAVGVVEARRQAVTELTEFIGRVEAIQRVDIRARVTGYLEARLFQEGSEVEEGAPLFRIERAPFEAQLEQARAAVASAEAQLYNARVALARAR